MSKESIVWLGVRSFGVFLSYHGIQAAISFLAMVLLLSQTRQGDVTVPVVLQQFLLTAFYLGSGLYLLIDGTLLFDRLVAQHPNDKVDQSVNESSIRHEQNDR